MNQWQEALYESTEKFSEMVRKARKRSGVSLQDLSDITGISKTHLHMIERGTTENPSAYIVWKLCKVLWLDPAKCVESIGRANALKDAE